MRDATLHRILIQSLQSKCCLATSSLFVCLNVMFQCRASWLSLLVLTLVWLSTAPAQGSPQDPPLSSPQDPAQDPPQGEEPTKSEIDTKSIAYWVEQLDSDQFLRRQTASKRLVEFGDEAVESLAEVTAKGQLEMTERAIAILQLLASKQSPDDETGAWGALRRLVDQGGGSAATRATAAIGLISKDREEQAHERLAAAGLKLDYREFTISNLQVNDNVVIIDSAWNGDIETLRWLRWIKRVTYAIVEGEAVNAEVMEFVVRMPDLRTVVIRNASLNSDIFTPLAKLARIDRLQFSYVKLTEVEVEKIAKLPIRIQLGLMGTALPAETLTKLRAAVPDLAIDFKMGGFLGVKCLNLSDACQIDLVIRNGAAADAGLTAGDVIEQVNGIPIAKFEDLIAEISKHSAGDEIEISFDRQGEKKTVKLGLKPMKAE